MAEEFAASSIADWVSGSGEGSTDIGQEVECEALDFELFVTCNEPELAVRRAFD